ncbi:MAG: MBL fold metallo-hydrolase [Acidimicrobiia bacterium]
MTAIRRVLAPNPGPYTGPGTNSYVVEDGRTAVVIDPGPVIATHLDAIVEDLAGLEPRAVVVTHTHPDHAPGANPLGERLDVPVLGHSPGPMFIPDETLRDGDTVDAGTFSLVAVYTPGHAADHLCYLVGSSLFTGDHIMGGSTVIIEDGAAYMRSLRRVLDLAPRRLYPGHGDEIPDAAAAVREYIDHRVERELQVLRAVGGGAGTVSAIVDVVYAEVEPALRAAATHQVVVQLKKLASEGRVRWRSGGANETDVITLVEE